MNDAPNGRILAQETTMLSTVILGLKASKAHALGWDKEEPTWKEIADAAKAGQFTFGMTNPTTSNSGWRRPSARHVAEGYQPQRFRR